MEWQEMARGYLAQLAMEEKSHATLEKYRRALRRFAAFAAGRPPEKPLVLAYKAHLAARCAVATANGSLAAVNGMLKFAGRSECCVRQFKVQRKTFCAPEKELTRQEYARLVRAAQKKRDPRLCLVLQTICGTGIRVSELVHITAEAVRRGEASITCKGKTRAVFLPRALQKKLLAYCRARHIQAGPVFVTRSGRPLTRYFVWRAMKSLCRDAGVAPGKVFPHNLRHLFARVFYALEHDIAKLADLLGHSSINTTRIYIISTGAEHRRKLERMHLIL